MGRHEQREQLFKLLFRVEFNSMEDMPEQIKLFFQDEETEYTQKAMDAISEKYEKISNEISKQILRGSTAIYSKGIRK